MSGNVLLDTNIIIGLFNKENLVREKLAEEKSIFIPSFVFGELYFGAFKSSRKNENLERIEKFSEENEIIFPDFKTSQIYGETKNQLRQKGRPIPENDIWIASLAKQHGLRLFSRDRHFSEVDDLNFDHVLSPSAS